MSEPGPEPVAQRHHTEPSLMPQSMSEAGVARGRRTSSRLANDAWEALLTAHAALMKQFAAEDVWHGLTMREYDVLYTLSKCREPIRPAELNRHVLLTQPALSRMVDRLIDRGFVERSRDPADGRGVRLALTPAGRTQQRRIGGRHAVGVARAVAGALTDDELLALEHLCTKLADTTNRTQR
ncbi:MarR family winged helix-turn-helix transcriptional regulator [Nocardia carnea]|uniref:MarR family winged helix-turn-helix transcriptional regulator n=1 Tax=Nocardia carnea TaxID=37328 RepID=UPI002458B393|nr:MarR family transcriptional regulator [Nocardia carnea]